MLANFVIFLGTITDGRVPDQHKMKWETIYSGETTIIYIYTNSGQAIET